MMGKAVNFLILAILAFLLTLQAIAASTFETYQGTTQWRVEVTEDETDCGSEGPTTETIVVNIEHSQKIATVGGLGHGPARGSFTANTLSVPARTIPDGLGESALFGFDAVFLDDCSMFSAQYRWEYSDPDMECSGTTKLIGTRLDNQGCPGDSEKTEGQKRKDILDARAEGDYRHKEALYAAILSKDPENFWANWDMADLKKKQGDYSEFFRYFDKAASNKDIFKNTKEELKKEAAQSLHLSEFPTRGKSPILRIEQDEINSWDGGLIYDVAIPQEQAADKPSLLMKLWTVFVPKSQSIVNEIVGLPED